ncbi:MAG: zinc metallopeptidase [Gammaproteobacteria bacterium]|nr:zinc metallopeptidase [Gammaproteobacteria bacterium]
MRWRGNRQSQNVEDRRGSRISGGGGSGGGLLRFLPAIYRLLGFKGTAIAVVGIAAYGLYTGNLSQILGAGSVQGNSTKTINQPIKQSTEEKETVEFISVVLADTEDTWKVLFKETGKQYQEPRLVLFRDKVKSSCGYGSAQMGPFYCPTDKKVYIDLSFYDDLKNRYKAPGDFAQAYVIAHEIGHHVQNLFGTSGKVHKAKQKLSTVKANQLSVKLELQADCYAGIWANHANRSRQILESGDIEEGLKAASAIGDDRLQKQSQGHVNPDSFTHGTSKQRVKWFNVGLEKGSLSACNTFSAKIL